MILIARNDSECVFIFTTNPFKFKNVVLVKKKFDQAAVPT
jgi:hypothetical protein